VNVGSRERNYEYQGSGQKQSRNSQAWTLNAKLSNNAGIAKIRFKSRQKILPLQITAQKLEKVYPKGNK